MNIIQKITLASTLLTSIALPLSSMAQTAVDHKGMDHPKMATTQAVPMTEGEVKKVDLAAGKMTIKHGPIQNMGMPGMTMVFSVKDKKMLTGIKAGDKIKFIVISEGGNMVITKIASGR